MALEFGLDLLQCNKIIVKKLKRLEKPGSGCKDWLQGLLKKIIQSELEESRPINF